MTSLLLHLFIKNPSDINSPAVRESYGRLAGIVGIACNLLLCVIKILIGTVTGGMSIVADGLNNLSDMGSSVITLIGFKMAGKPADSDHPFGHGRIEYLSAFIVAVLILLVGAELVMNAVKSLVSGEAAPQYSLWAIVILAISVGIKFWMFLFNRRLGKSIDSDVLKATAQDSVNDCIATTVILISVAVSLFVTLPFNLDAVMTLGVGIFILYSGFCSAKGTVDDLLGLPPEPQLIEEIEKTILSFNDFIGIHDLIVHNYGPGRQFASVHVEVPQNVDIVTCHEHIDLCEKLVNERTGVLLVIHTDPMDVDNQAVNAAKKNMSNEIKKIDGRLTLHDFRMTPSGNQRTNLIFDVVVPSDIKLSNEQLKEKIQALAVGVDPKYCCVITIDNDFTGNKY